MLSLESLLKWKDHRKTTDAGSKTLRLGCTWKDWHSSAACVPGLEDPYKTLCSQGIMDHRSNKQTCFKNHPNRRVSCRDQPGL
jgi:hypothetical protein